MESIHVRHKRTVSDIAIGKLETKKFEKSSGEVSTFRICNLIYIGWRERYRYKL